MGSALSVDLRKRVLGAVESGVSGRKAAQALALLNVGPLFATCRFVWRAD